MLPAQCRIVRELNAARSANNSAECKWVPSQICHRKCFGLKDCAVSSKFKRKTSQWWNDDDENKTNVQLCWAQVNKGKSEKKRWKMEKEKEGGKWLDMLFCGGDERHRGNRRKMFGEGKYVFLRRSFWNTGLGNTGYQGKGGEMKLPVWYPYRKYKISTSDVQFYIVPVY